MPNTPAVVGKGAAAIAAGTLADDTHLELAERVLGAVGIVVRVPEAQLDAVTGLSGSGPAYLFLLAEAMIDAGVLVGLPRATADALVRQTLLGAATLLERAATRRPSRCAPRSRHRAARPRRRCRRSRRTACAPRCSTRSRPRPAVRASRAGAHDATAPVAPASEAPRPGA